jgi:hypothetical protein
VRTSLILSALIVGCGATVSADVRHRYATETARCIANERAIIDRQGTSYEQDRDDLDVERARCNAALEQIGGAP